MSSVIERIAQDLKLDFAYVKSIISRSNFYYKDYYIPKHNGKKRKISQPSPELKSLQYWVLRNVLIYLPVSQSAFAYKRGDSVKKHARYHADSKFIFHTDIKDFFPNIHSEALSTIIIENREALLQNDVWYIDLCDVVSKICFRHDSLCVGTVTSPCISNVALCSFDKWASDFCKDGQLKYSRYADDLYISSQDYIPSQIAGEVVSKLHSYNFTINRDKTWFRSKKFTQRITGLIITTDGQVSVGTEARNKIKQMVYSRLVNGQGSPEVILGYLAYLKDIEPNTYNRLITKYSVYCDGDIISAITCSKP